MLWLQPAAWLGLVALAAPLLIHLLVHRRSEPFPFPTLRFLQPTRLASLRRHRIDDPALLLVRLAILAAAVAALAGPLLVTQARRASWNRRVARAIVVDPGEPGRDARIDIARRESAAAYRSTIIEADDAALGLRRAAEWLAGAPPARREILCVSPLAIGVVTASDVSAVPREIGLRFVRSGSLPQKRTIPGPPVLGWGGARAGPSGQNRTVTLTGKQTSVRDAAATTRTVLPLEIAAPAAAQAIVDAALAAVLHERVPAPAAGRAAHLLIADAPDAARIRTSAVAIHTPWIGDAVARIVADDDVVRVAGQIAAAPDASLQRAPWQMLAAGSNGAPVAAAAQIGDRLLVASVAPPDNLLTPVLIRSVLRALADRTNVQAAEIVPIADAQLRAWERPAGPALAPGARTRPDRVDDDRRWLWGAVLCLIALEGWMRARAQESAGIERAAAEGDRVA